MALDDVRRHLRRVRWRLAWVLGSMGVGFGVTLFYRAEIFAFILAPGGGDLSASGSPIFISPTEMMWQTIKLAIMGGVVVATPIAIFHVARFLSPVMTPAMRRFSIVFLPAGLLFYLVGVGFAYFALLPVTMGFLLHFGEEIAEPMIRITDYMDIATSILFWTGVIFELPLAMLLLSRFGLVRPARFQRLMVIVFPGSFVFAAIITPSADPLTSLILATGIIGLWQVGVVLAWLFRPRAPRTV